MSRPRLGSVGELLAKWNDGDQEALRSLMPLVYNELRRLARHCLQKEPSDHTLQSTALVHEAYLRLTKQGAVHFENRAHFFAVSARLMRQILVDYARSRRAAKRGGGCKLTLDEAVALPKGRDVDLVALDDALNDLFRLDARSEEHTSELQSLAYLVCRLLLEKKKTQQRDHVFDSGRVDVVSD